MSAWFMFFDLGEYARSKGHTRFREKGGRLFWEKASAFTKATADKES
jgi:hypothetical protein